MATRAPAFGLKEVADVALYEAGVTVTFASEITTTSDIGYTVAKGDATTTDMKFLFDSLKVSNIEVSSEDASATGGRGNPELISWSYSKEITFTMEDALFSLSTLDLMFGASGPINDPTSKEVVINADSFPGNYAIVGKTYIRDQATGKDSPFFFYIPNAKIQVNGTLTMEADGDPTTFEMQVKALKGKYTDAESNANDNTLVVFKQIAYNVEGAGATHHSSNVSSQA